MNTAENLYVYGNLTASPGSGQSSEVQIFPVLTTVSSKAERKDRGYVYKTNRELVPVNPFEVGNVHAGEITIYNAPKPTYGGRASLFTAEDKVPTQRGFINFHERRFKSLTALMLAVCAMQIGVIGILLLV